MKLVREPLVQFAVIGLLLFVASSMVRERISSDADRRIVIDRAAIEQLAEGFRRQWQRPPTEEELRALIESRLREEVLYRQALEVGLDDNDVVVRRRMVQKMELLTQDLALMADPTEQELQAFFDEHRDDYIQPPRISFTHVYLNPDHRGDSVESDALDLLDRLRVDPSSGERAAELGDRFMLGHDFRLRTPFEVAREFGTGFADVVFELDPGWHGPILSGYGLHLVLIGDDRVEARAPELVEVRERVVNDFNRLRRENANEAVFQGLVEGYEVVVDEEALRTVELSRPGNEDSTRR